MIQRRARSIGRLRVQALLALALLALAFLGLALGTTIAASLVGDERVNLREPRHTIAEICHRAGIAARESDRSTVAMKRFAWAIRARADHLDARVELVRLYQETGRFIEAGKVLDTWLESRPAARLNAMGEADLPMVTQAGTENRSACAMSDESTAAGWLFHFAGINHFMAGQAVSARALHEQALAIARAAEDRPLEAATLIGRARVAYHLAGEVEAARSDLDRALLLAREAHDPKLEADALRNLGVLAWWFEGAAGHALTHYYRPARALYRGVDDRRGAATTSSNIGLVYASLGDPARALAAHEEALVSQRALGDRAGEVDTLRNLAALYAATGDRAVARQRLRDSLSLARATGYRLAANGIEAVLAGHHEALGDHDQALALLERVLEREGDTPLLASYRLWSMADLARLAGRPREAERYARRAQERQPPGAEIETRSRVARLLIRAELKRDLGDWTSAERLLDEARALLATGTESGRWHWDTLLVAAEVAEHLGRAGPAMSMLDLAADEEAAWLAEAPSWQGPMVHAERYDRLYGLLLGADSALRANKMLAERADLLAFRFVEHARHRAFRGHSVYTPSATRASPESKALLTALEEQVRDRIDDRVQHDRSATEQSGWHALRATYDTYQEAVVRKGLLTAADAPSTPDRPCNLAATHDSIDSATALIAYVFAGKQVFALVLRNGAVVRFALPTDRASLRAKIRLLDALLAPAAGGTHSDEIRPSRALPNQTESSQAGTDEDWAPVAASLWRLLIEPLVQGGALDRVDRLGILPADALSALPFAALLDDSGPLHRFLVEDFALFFPSSACALMSGDDRERSTRTSGETLAVAVSQAIDDLPALPFAHAEARFVTAALGGETLLDSDASETAFKARAGFFRTIHVASHALPFPDLPLLSAIKLAPTEEDDGNLTVAEILALNLSTDLVTLASCRGATSSTLGTGRPDERRRFSLIDAFLRAGSRAVVASLLPVDDRSTRIFMEAFYRHLADQDPVAALASAQRAMLEGPRPDRHPRHWAPFVLVGRAPTTSLSVGTQ